MAHSLKSLIYLLLVISGFSLSASNIGEQRNLFKVDKVIIKGLKKVEKEAVLEKISTKAGQVVTNYNLKNDIEKIYNLKYFESVEAHQEGKNLVYILKEKPIVAEIKLLGNDEVSADDITGVLKVKEYSILDINTVKTDIKAILKLYEEKGFYLANAKYKVQSIDDENVRLSFLISEFDKVKVKKVTFLGNQAFSDDELKGIMETREESLFSFMSGSGSFKELGFRTDVERIKYFYRTKGYLQVNLGTPEVTISEDKKWVFVTVKVNEGPKFKIRDIRFGGEVLFEEEKLLKDIQLKSGDVYSEELLRTDIQKLTELYQDEGYAFANVLRTLQVVPGENLVDIQFSFEKGKIARFGTISIKGNTKTRDKVVRRELRIKEGTKFSGSKLRESKENVNRLGFFEPGSVIFNTVSPPGSDDVIDVEITVKEQSTGQISLGAGYSTATGGFFQASIAQNNFRGLGQQLSFRTNLAAQQTTFSLSFTEPYFLDTLWTTGGEIFTEENQQFNSYDFKRQGFSGRLGYPIFEWTRLFATYKLVDTEFINIREEAREFINPDTENGLTSSIRFSLLTDKRNHRFEPTKGYFLNLATEYAGLGGDFKYIRNELDTRYFKRVVGDLIFRSRFYTAKIEVIDNSPIPQNERFTLGGPRNLRGYDFDSIGPLREIAVDANRDGVINADDNGATRLFNDGSLFTAFSTVELEHPLAREAGLKWVVFFDAGTASEFDDMGKIYMNYGFGFRWFSPIGVLRFEFGFPINPDPQQEGNKFHFDIGQLF